jgi:hypothetical protein
MSGIPTYKLFEADSVASAARVAALFWVNVQHLPGSEGILPEAEKGYNDGEKHFDLNR